MNERITLTPECARAKSPPLWDISFADSFVSQCRALIQERTIPYLWEVINDRVDGIKKSYCVHNFKVAAGLKEGVHQGKLFQDCDIYKWLEGAAYSLQTKPDEHLEALMDEAIDYIVKAQCPDGYINTYYTLVCPEKRWTNLQECHELYCAGHLFEAAVANYEATGKDRLLRAACLFADYIDSVFGCGEGQIRGYPGHQEIELALIKLYRATGCERYLKLAKYFIDERGRAPNYFDLERAHPYFAQMFPELTLTDPTYFQTHLPPVMQTDAVGHAVRAVYMYSAMADLAEEYDDEALLETCRTLFDSIAQKRMYITGGIGSAENGERFTGDYDLPGDYGYMETCASVGLMMFASRMARIERDARYIDVLERAFYNAVLAGISLGGDRFFYVNPLSVNPEIAKHNTNLSHVKPERQRWFDVPCCPTNIARTLASLGQYLYTLDGDTLFVNLYTANSASFSLDSGRACISVQTEYPFGGAVSLVLSGSFKLALRLPDGCQLTSLTVDGNPVRIESGRISKGYLYLRRDWSQTVVALNFDMPVLKMRPHPRVSAGAGCLALMKGPIVYAVEQIDNGENLSALSVEDQARVCVQPAPAGLPGQADSLILDGWRDCEDGLDGILYTSRRISATPVRIRAVPYCLWANRGVGEMRVFIRERTSE